jgi:3-oxoadipate enol-lactonase
VPGGPRLAFDQQGQGALLVFLHGIGGNRGNWQDQFPAFARHFHTVAWDARGYGDSDDYDGPVAIADFSADLRRLIDYIGARTAHLVGLSMGGRIAMDFYERHPARVATLTLCDTHPGFAGLRADQREAFLRLRQAPLLAGKAPRDIAPDLARSLVGPNASPAVLQRLIDSLAALRKDSYLKALAAIANDAHSPALEQVRVPTLVVVGAEDRLTPPKVARAMAARIPGAQLSVIADAGHLSNIEQPARFNEAVLSFLLADSVEP